LKQRSACLQAANKQNVDAALVQKPLAMEFDIDIDVCCVGDIKH